MSLVDLETRPAVSAREAEAMDSAELRAAFLVTDLFRAGRAKAVFTPYDRMVLLGAVPLSAPIEVGLALGGPIKEADFLARREIGLFNLGGPGSVEAGGARYALGEGDALYLPRGAAGLTFRSDDPARPARFYGNSAPAHAAHPVRHVPASAQPGDTLGATETANRRVLAKVFHPDAGPTCQLVMGRTEMQPGNVWNTMPPHTHDRRVATYLYFRLPEGQAVFHFMGRPEATRHLIVRNEEAVISPPWSIHCGCGTSAYTFLWSMAGENQAFSDMDAAPIASLV